MALIPKLPTLRCRKLQSSMFDMDFATAQLANEMEALTHQAIDQIYVELPDYSRIPRTDIYSSAKNLVACPVLALELGDAEEALAATKPNPAETRYNQGVSVDSAMRAGRICVDLVQQRFREVYRENDLPLAHCLLGLEIMWRVSDLLMQRTVSEFRNVAGQRRLATLEFFRHLESEAPEEHRVKAGQVIGLSETGRYHLLMIRTPEPDAVVRTLESALTGRLSPARGVEFDSFVAAVVPEESMALLHGGRMAPIVAESAIADSGPTSFSLLPKAWHTARLVLDSIPADTFGLVDLGSVSWRIAVPGNTRLTEHLKQKYLTPLGTDILLLESVWAFIGNNKSYRRAAAQLFVHENTLRHRVVRFTELTGVSLDQADTLFELLWLKQALALDATV